MNGQPIAQAKRAVERGLKLMQPDDTFQLINFSTSASQLGPAPLAASRDNVQRGLDYLNTLNGDGGTMMIEGIKAALDFPHDPKRLRFVVFCTDGYIGNEAEIFGEVHNRLRDSRIFSFGVGTSVNRYLLDGLARLGRGAVAYLSLNESAQPVMDTFFERISHPAMTDLVADWGGLQVTDVYPHQLHDLFVGRPMIITGRFKSDTANLKSATIRIKGKAGPHDAAIDIPVSGSESNHAGLAAVWARMKIADLSARSTYEGGNELPGEIKGVALEYGLMSQFTSFVAVDSLTKTAGNHGTSVAVPVPVPDGVKYETTVQE
jgi:Ca-activated chloride channel homolog